MTAPIFHPLSFAIFCAAIATTGIFAWLTVTFAVQHRASHDAATTTYAWFTGTGAVSALIVAATFVPMPAWAKIDAFRLVWVFGCWSGAAWMLAVATFVNMDHRGVRWIVRFLIGVGFVPALDLTWVHLGGETWFFSAIPRTSDWPLLLASGNVYSHNALTNVTALVVSTAVLAFTAITVLWIGRHRPDEQALRGAVLLTGLSAIAEIVLGTTGTPIPLLFLANHVEAMRIAWVGTLRIGVQIEQLRHEEQTREALIESQREQLRQTDLLARVGEETARIAHDLRNPLSAVVSGLELVEELSSEDRISEDSIHDALHQTRRAVDHTLNLVTRLNRQSRRADDDRPRPVALPEILETTRVLCRQRLEGIDVYYEIEPDVAILGSEPALVQLLVNLVSNASDACRATPSARSGSPHAPGTTPPRSGSPMRAVGPPTTSWSACSARASRHVGRVPGWASRSARGSWPSTRAPSRWTGARSAPPSWCGCPPRASPDGQSRRRRRSSSAARTAPKPAPAPVPALEHSTPEISPWGVPSSSQFTVLSLSQSTEPS